MVILKPCNKAGVDNMGVEAASPTNPEKSRTDKLIEICRPSKDASTLDKKIYECMAPDGSLIGL